jgi:hypothetical protein
VLDEAALQPAAAAGSPLAEMLGQEPSPEFAAEVAFPGDSAVCTSSFAAICPVIL